MTDTSRRQAAGILALWVFGATVATGGWVIARTEQHLGEVAQTLPEIELAQAQGATLSWSGRTAYLTSDSLNASQTAEVVAALAEIAGVRAVKLVDVGTKPEVADPVPPGTVPPGTVPPSTVPPSTVPPGTVPPGTVPPGTVPPGTVPPGTVPPGTVPPGTVPPSTVPPTTGLQSSADAVAALAAILEGRTIEFLFSTAIPTPDTQGIVADLISLMEQYPDLQLHIVGHTDPVGNEEANQELSRARAQSIANHLILAGIDPSRMSAEGRGSSEPINDNESFAAREQNRRVTIEAR